MPRRTVRVSSSKKSLRSPLKPSYSELAAHCAALKIENAKLHKRIVKLETQKLSADNRIVALEEHLKDTEHHHAPSLTDIESLDKLCSRLAESLINHSSNPLRSLSTKTS